MKSLLEKFNININKFIEEPLLNKNNQEFILTAIRSNINENACSQCDLTRVNYNIKKIANHLEQHKTLVTAATISYILFNELDNLEISKEDEIKVKMIILEISTAITDYFTFRESLSGLSKLNDMSKLNDKIILTTIYEASLN